MFRQKPNLNNDLSKLKLCMCTQLMWKPSNSPIWTLIESTCHLEEDNFSGNVVEFIHSPKTPFKRQLSDLKKPKTCHFLEILHSPPAQEIQNNISTLLCNTMNCAWQLLKTWFFGYSFQPNASLQCEKRTMTFQIYSCTSCFEYSFTQKGKCNAAFQPFLED